MRRRAGQQTHAVPHGMAPRLQRTVWASGHPPDLDVELTGGVRPGYGTLQRARHAECSHSSAHLACPHLPESRRRHSAGKACRARRLRFMVAYRDEHEAAGVVVDADQFILVVAIKIPCGERQMFARNVGSQLEGGTLLQQFDVVVAGHCLKTQELRLMGVALSVPAFWVKTKVP